MEIESAADMNWVFEHLDSCVICGGRRFRTIFREVRCGIPLQFDRCTDCSFIFQNPRLTRESLGDYFNSSIFIQDSKSNDDPISAQLGYFDYFAWDQSYKKTAAIRLNRLSKFRPLPGKLLEIGSATGSFLDSARHFGYQVRGLDVSRTFAEGAKQRYGLEIDVGWIEDFPLPPETYDVVCMFGGISCWRDLMKGLANVHQTLQPDGVFYFNYQDYYGLLGRLMGNRYPEFNHASLSLLHRRSIHDCLAKAGFRVLVDVTERQIASLERIVNYLQIGAARRLVTALGLGNIEIPIWVSGTKIVVATKC